MKVSVSITTYNHGKYIAQAIESVLMQKTNFDFEIIIGEDDSEDDTRAIVKEYKKKYPDRIKLFLNDRENVIYIDGRPTGRWNFINNLNHATGEYIALLDGDDYWTDPHKLQKQVDFLDSNPDFVICCHPVIAVNENSTKPEKILSSPTDRDIYTIEDLLNYGNIIDNCSVVFRRGLFGPIPEWFKIVKYGDWPLHILNSQYGKIKYINEIMATYRIHSGGVWSKHSQLSQLEMTIDTLKIVGKHLNITKNRNYKKRLSKYLLLLSRQHAKQGNLLDARRIALQGIFYHPFGKITKNFIYLTKLYVLWLFTFLKFLKRAQNNNIT